jgi:predicted TIM-barrel fold metal-dependent hydrolase
MIVDCHANVGWDVSNTRKNLFPTERSYRRLLQLMDEYNVEKAVMVPFPSPGGMFNENTPWYDLENNYLVQAAQFSPRLIPFLGVNPADRRSVHNINTTVLAHTIKGVKFSHQIPMGFSIDRLMGHSLMNIVQESNLIMMIHVGTGKEKGADAVHTTLDYGLQVAKKYPRVRFVFCHLGRLHESMLETLQLPNVWMDTAGLALHQNWQQFVARNPLQALQSSTPQEIIEQLVEWGHEDSIVFGSDEPYTHYHSQLSHITDADISEQAKRKILGGNMLKLLKD